MTDVPATPQPRRRRWKRWTIVGALLLGIVLFMIWFDPNNTADMRHARSVRLGQTFEQVSAIMGPGVAHHRGDELIMQYGRYQKAYSDFVRALPAWTGSSTDEAVPDDWPVQVHFDANGRVDRIKRGSEIIEAPEAMTDQSLKPRRRWKRWTALALVLAIGCGVWMSGESETVRKARRLQLGMTTSDVNHIMGPPTFAGRTTPTLDGRTTEYRVYTTRGEMIGPALKGATYLLLRRLGVAVDALVTDFPVRIVFDESGRVSQIRRGSEIVGQ